MTMRLDETDMVISDTGVRAHPGAVSVCEGFAELVNIGFSEAVELALWRRSPPKEVQDLFCKQDFFGFQDFRVDGTAEEVLSATNDFLDMQEWDDRLRDFVVSDVMTIIASTSDSSMSFTLRLEYVTDDACRKFHKDQTDIRLITTYMGRGSQWINVCDENLKPEIQEMETFEVGMFLGERYDDLRGIFHRSPPIENTEMAERFMMVIDVERAGKC